MPKELNVPDRGPRREITVEEAAICPKCNRPGVLTHTEKKQFIDEAGEKWDVVVYTCDNNDCDWFNTGWPVSSNERGIVFQRDQGPRGQDKTFEVMTPGQLSFGRQLVENVIQEEHDTKKKLDDERREGK